MLTLWALILLNPVPGVSVPPAMLRITVACTSANTRPPLPCAYGQN